MIEILITLRTLNYGNYGTILVLGNAGFISSTVFRPELWTRNVGGFAL